MLYTPPSPNHNPQHPRPRFCLFRPGGLLAPLIPVDELPSWIQICNWSPDMYMGLQPVSLSYIPREGEFDVICYHCSSSVDSQLQSMSERIDDVQSPESVEVASPSRSWPGAFGHSAGVCGSSPAVSQAPMTLPTIGQPPFHASLQKPYVGMCMVDSRAPLWHQGTLQPDELIADPLQPQEPAVFMDPVSAGGSRSSDGSQKSSLNPQAASFVFSNSTAGHGLSSASVKASRRIANRVPTPGPNMRMAAGEGSDCSMASPNESRASTRSITAAVERLKATGNKRVSRDTSFYQSSRSGTGKLTTRSHASTHRTHMATQRRRRARMRRRRPKRDRPKPATEPAEDKPVQPNAATKRQERRERMAQGRKNADSSSRYWHMMMIPNWRSNVPQR